MKELDCTLEVALH